MFLHWSPVSLGKYFREVGGRGTGGDLGEAWDGGGGRDGKVLKVVLHISESQKPHKYMVIGCDSSHVKQRQELPEQAG